MYPGHIEIGTPVLSFRCGFLCVPIQPYSSFPTSQVQWMSYWPGQGGLFGLIAAGEIGAFSCSWAEFCYVSRVHTHLHSTVPAI